MTAPVVVGGLGVSGLGCALELTRRGIDFLALEQEDRPGGLARSEQVDGFRFDYGPHIVLGVPAGLRPVLAEAPGLELEERAGRSCVALGGDLARVVPVPLQRHLNHLPLGVRGRLLLDLARAGRGDGGAPTSYGEYAVSRCGREVFDLFLHGYETKRLRYDVHDMPPDWTERVPRPSLSSLVQPRWTTRFRDGIESRFHYPGAGGIEALPRSLARLLPAESVRCSSEIVAIDADAGELALANGARIAYEQLVLSLPLPAIVAMLKDPPRRVVAAARDLLYTSIYVVSLGLEEPVAAPWTLIRFPARELPFYRVSFPTRYAPDAAPDGHAVVVAETSHHPTRHPLRREEALDATLRGLTRLGILGRGQGVVAERVCDIRFGHVVYNHRTRESVRVVFDYLNARSILTCGKYGLWEDLLMTHSILSGIAAARQVAERSEHAQKRARISLTA